MLPTIVLSLALAAGPVFATPLVLPKLIVRQDAGTCRNQSCEIATVAGSTGLTKYPYSTYPMGDTQDGDCCIIRYFPAVKDEIFAHRPGLQAYCASHGGTAPKDANPPGITHVSEKRDVEMIEYDIEERDLSERATCKPNILIFVKGTFEPGPTGILVGPQLASALPSNLWSVQGVNYDNGIAGDYCLGLPAGVTTRHALINTAARCPNSRLFLSGYSQGAMAVRNALARAPKAVVNRVKHVVNFGDPMVGAQIGQYSGPISVFCMADDGVCTGNFDITFGHLSYAVDIGPAAQILEADQASA